MKITVSVLTFAFILLQQAFAVRNGADNRVLLTEDQQIPAVGGLMKFPTYNPKFNDYISNPFMTYTIEQDQVNSKVLEDYKHPLCKDNLLYGLKSNYSCTVFLISKDEVMTAGHCVFPNQTPLTQNLPILEWSYKVSFGYDVSRLTDKNTYSVISVIEAQYNSNFGDYAILKLDREVEGIEVLTLNKTRQTKNNQSGDIYTVGYPMGSSVQVMSTQGNFVKPTEMIHKTSFRTTLDINSGNSGSPVFNKQGEVIGIVSRTSFPAGFYTRDPFILNHKNKCMEDLVIPDEYNSTVIQRIDTIFDKDINWEFQGLVSLGAFERLQKSQLTIEDLFNSGDVDINAKWISFAGSEYSTLGVALLNYERTKKTEVVEFLLEKGVEIDHVAQLMAELYASKGDPTILDLFAKQTALN